MRTGVRSSAANPAIEECEVRSIQVMLGQGRESDARNAGQRFRQRHPTSQLLPAVDALLKDSR